MKTVGQDSEASSSCSNKLLPVKTSLDNTNTALMSGHQLNITGRMVYRMFFLGGIFVCPVFSVLLLQELVVDVAVATSFRHADLS